MFPLELVRSLVRVHATVLERVECEGGVVRVLARHLAHLDVSAGKMIQKSSTVYSVRGTQQALVQGATGERTRRGQCGTSICQGWGCVAGNTSSAVACSAHFAGTGTEAK